MSISDFSCVAPRRTLADCLAELGDIPPERIIIPGHPGPATEEDVVALCQGADKRLCELVDGTLVEKVMGNPESEITQFLARKLGDFVDAHRVGIMLGAAGLIRLFPPPDSHA